tara:strand:- start:587 stop:871 length:285 start_codon:yes stop_codon:yes gene_type:complete
MNGIIGIIQTTRLTMSEEELQASIKLLIAERDGRRERAFKKVKFALKKGDAVSFINNSGERVTGEVTKVKTKKALVQVGNTSWDVPMGMLSLTR